MTFLTALAAGCADHTMPVAQLPEIDTNNPLLAEWNTPHETPPFDRIRVSDYEPAFDAAIAVSRAEIDAIVNNPAKPTFNNTIVALDRQGRLLSRVEGIFFNLLEADATPEMQQVAENVQPKLTALSNDISLNPQLFERVKAVYEHPGWFLSKEDKKLLEEIYNGFVRSGANLSDEDKELYRQYSTELSELSLRFSRNVLAATNAFTINITDPAQVAELPDFVRDGMAAEAKARGEQGWTVTLQAPSYIPFMEYSTNRELKEKLWRANSSLCLGGEFDNTENIERMVNLRLKIANLLGYPTYADYVLADRMAENAQTVNAFLGELLARTKEYAVKDYNTIGEYARSQGFEGEVMPWDMAYYSEKYRHEKYELNEELVKPYLQLDSVKRGVFLLANKLYGLNFTPNPEVPVYHPEVTAYDVTDKDGRFLAELYLDFFPRATKRGGAWETEFRSVSIVEGHETRPLVSLVMNFTKPTDTTPSLLTFSEFETFLHEFGHALHAILSEGEHESISGTHVYQDFVELPSQIMENWATEKEFLDLWAVNYKTGEPIPADLIAKIVAAENYQAAYFNVRQVAYALNDMAWHSIDKPFEGDVELFERTAMAPSQILPVVDGAAMSPAFSHIFAGGYAAGYYGYKWAEVLAADAFSLFKEKGIFNPEVAEAFRREILSKGGHEHPMTLYVNFRGHKPETKALIEKMGLEKSSEK
ncbi:M3 family metallopeptidase [Alistipes putredinis]